jgi:hypothetical protein
MNHKEYSYIKYNTATFANSILTKYNLIPKGWTFKFKSTYDFRSHSVLGTCSKENKNIFLNKHYLKKLSFYELKNVVLHEVAHAIDIETRGYSKHDMIWFNICLNIGYKFDEDDMYVILKEQFPEEVEKNQSYINIKIKETFRLNKLFNLKLINQL